MIPGPLLPPPGTTVVWHDPWTVERIRAIEVPPGEDVYQGVQTWERTWTRMRTDLRSPVRTACCPPRVACCKEIVRYYFSSGLVLDGPNPLYMPGRHTLIAFKGITVKPFINDQPCVLRYPLEVLDDITIRWSSSFYRLEER